MWVPLASGLLTGKFSQSSTFEKDDHRFFNREGAMFDKGETFSGVPYNLGLVAVEEMKNAFPDFDNLAPIALRWILDFPQISCIIPGSSKPEHTLSNLSAMELLPLNDNQREKLKQIYEIYVKNHVHHLW